MLLNETLRAELVAMRAEDLRVREELLETGELGHGYAPRMEAIHRKNAQRLREIIAEYGWPDTGLAGSEGTLAAWFIAQHVIGEPDFSAPGVGADSAQSKAGRSTSRAGSVFARPCCHVRGAASAVRHSISAMRGRRIPPLEN